MFILSKFLSVPEQLEKSEPLAVKRTVSILIYLDHCAKNHNNQLWQTTPSLFYVHQVNARHTFFLLCMVSFNTHTRIDYKPITA